MFTNLTLTSVVFEYIVFDINDNVSCNLTLTSVVFEFLTNTATLDFAGI